MVCYQIDTEERAKEMEAVFPQLLYRVQSLEERVVSYYLRGDAHCVVSYERDNSHEPHFLNVTFDEAKAEKYEAQMRRFFTTYKNKVSSALPRPKFAVRLEVALGGGVSEMFDFSFIGYCEETMLAFCKAVEARASDLFRHRFSLGRM